MATIELNVNGAKRTVEVVSGQSLLTTLRDGMDITGPKYGCGEGQCGACTVLLDGKPVRSCITPVEAAAGKAITTVEGLEKDGNLHPVQEAFLSEGAYQCGYCTPGQILSAVALLQRNPDPSDADIRRAMQGNLCRCGTYTRIEAAIKRAAQSGRGAK